MNGIALAAIAATAALAWFGTGLHPLWWATWFAPVPVLLASIRLRPSAAFAAATVAWIIAGLNMWTYYRGAIGIPLPVSVAIVLLPALVFGAAVLLWRRFTSQQRALAAVLSPACVWACFEFAMSRLSPHSTFGSLGYTQMNFLPVVQVASLGGIYSVSFLVVLFSSLLATAVAMRGAARWKLAGAGAALFAVVIGWGWLRLAAAPSNPTATVALIASDGNQFADPEHAAQLAREYATAIQQSTADAIVIPEKLARVTDAVAHEVDTAFSTAASDRMVVAGVERWTAGRRLNQAIVYQTGAIRATYDKHHMIPGFEGDLTPGITRTVLVQPSGNWGVAICKDMDFPALSREYGRDGVGLMLVPAWDFNADGWLHGRMAIARGVESGFSIARAAKQGLLTVSDSRGRVIAQTASNSAPFALLQASVPVLHESTIYARYGDWFGWTGVAFLAILLAAAFSRRSPV